MDVADYDLAQGWSKGGRSSLSCLEMGLRAELCRPELSEGLAPFKRRAGGSRGRGKSPSE